MRTGSLMTALALEAFMVLDHDFNGLRASDTLGGGGGAFRPKLPNLGFRVPGQYPKP